MELIIAILFFSLASAVCIQLFVKSHLISKDTVNRNNAILQAQNLAEAWLAADGNPKQTAALLEHEILSEDGFDALFLLFDKDWVPLTDTTNPDICYVAELTTLGEADGKELLHALVTVYEVPEPQRGNWKPQTYLLSSVYHEGIYSLELAHHVAERRGNHE